MQKLLFVLAVLSLTRGNVANSVYHPYAKCNSSTIAAIKAYWANNTGRPKDVLNKFEESGNNILLHTSYGFKNDRNSCIYLQSANGIMNVTFVPNDGGVPATMWFRVVEDAEGIIRSKYLTDDENNTEYIWNWYTVYFGDGITVYYVCSDLEGSKEPPLADIVVSKHAFHNRHARDKIADLNNLLKGWGFNMRYNYEAECYLEDNPTSKLVSGPKSVEEL